MFHCGWGLVYVVSLGCDLLKRERKRIMIRIYCHAMLSTLKTEKSVQRLLREHEKRFYFLLLLHIKMNQISITLDFIVQWHDANPTVSFNQSSKDDEVRLIECHQVENESICCSCSLKQNPWQQQFEAFLKSAKIRIQSWWNVSNVTWYTPVNSNKVDKKRTIPKVEFPWFIAANLRMFTLLTANPQTQLHPTRYAPNSSENNHRKFWSILLKCENLFARIGFGCFDS